MENKLKVYLANGLFTQGDRDYNDKIYDALIKEGFEVYAPQKNLAINDKKKSAPSGPIYEGDTEKLKWCDVLLAVLDGQDLGVATEIGIVAGWNEISNTKRKIIGIYTDVRDMSITNSEEKNIDGSKDIAECQYPYINLYTIGAIKKHGVVVNNIDSAIQYLKTIK